MHLLPAKRKSRNFTQKTSLKPYKIKDQSLITLRKRNDTASTLNQSDLVNLVVLAIINQEEDLLRARGQKVPVPKNLVTLKRNQPREKNRVQTKEITGPSDDTKFQKSLEHMSKTSSQVIKQLDWINKIKKFWKQAMSNS